MYTIYEKNDKHVVRFIAHNISKPPRTDGPLSHLSFRKQKVVHPKLAPSECMLCWDTIHNDLEVEIEEAIV